MTTDILRAGAAGFEDAFAARLASREEGAPEVDAAVREILQDVRARGDDAVTALTRRFDRVDVAGRMRVGPDEIDAAIAAVPEDAREALALAAARIRAYHARQMPADESWTDSAGATLGWRWTPVDAAGLYVPGGTASYPSSVLMNAVPAKVAGVRRLVMCVPTPDDVLNPLVLAAARLAGVDEVYRIGGAQAVAAMAYGTASLAPVDVITGPGNAYVAAAKRQVFGHVGIDMVAGPSEVLVIADAGNDPDWIAVDLLSQAEHDPGAQAILIATDEGFARAALAAVHARLDTLERRGIAAASWARHGAVILARDLDEAARLADRVAPEHLQLAVADPGPLAARIRHAGAIFLGAWTPEAAGDYATGPNHVLPTGGTARFSSGLSVLDFLKRTTLQSLTPAAMRAIGPAAEVLARAEGLTAHALSLRLRLDRLN